MITGQLSQDTHHQVHKLRVLDLTGHQLTHRSIIVSMITKYFFLFYQKKVHKFTPNVRSLQSTQRNMLCSVYSSIAYADIAARDDHESLLQRVSGHTRYYCSFQRHSQLCINKLCLINPTQWNVPQGLDYSSPW